MARLKRLPEDVDFNKVALLYGETDDGMYVAVDVDDEGRIRVSDRSETKTITLSGNQTTIILTPTTGKRLRILGSRITQPGGAMDGALKFVTSNITVNFSIDPAQGIYQPGRIEGAINEPLTAIIANAAVSDQFFFAVNYEEF